MKKIISLVLCVVMMATLFTACDRTLTMEKILENTEIVMGKAGDQNVYAYEMLYLMSMGYDADTAFEELVAIKVMYQKALDNNISLTEEEIEAIPPFVTAFVRFVARIFVRAKRAPFELLFWITIYPFTGVT